MTAGRAPRGILVRVGRDDFAMSERDGTRRGEASKGVTTGLGPQHVLGLSTEEDEGAVPTVEKDIKRPDRHGSCKSGPGTVSAGQAPRGASPVGGPRRSCPLTGTGTDGACSMGLLLGRGARKGGRCGLCGECAGVGPSRRGSTSMGSDPGCPSTAPKVVLGSSFPDGTSITTSRGSTSRSSTGSWASSVGCPGGRILHWGGTKGGRLDLGPVLVFLATAGAFSP